MKYYLEVHYAGQIVRFENLEVDDEDLSDESYPEGVQANEDKLTENFMENVAVFVHKKRE